MRNMGFDCRQQCPVEVYYKQSEVGVYFADIIIDNKVILELKAGEAGI